MSQDPQKPSARGDASAEDPTFEALLEYLLRSRGFDFTGYKRASLKRRVLKRMQKKAFDSFVDYQDYLEANPDEFKPLFNTVLINVTGFFRDRPAWTHLADKVLPELLAQKSPSEPFRVWSAGCASGEEAYTLAIVLAELLGVEQFRARVKIYAADVDEEALATARHATYTSREVKDIPEGLLEKYFEPAGKQFTFNSDLRRSVIFGRHDLVQDAPISRLDLLVCRNTLMYFNSETQARILARFHFALNTNSALFLGKAEMLLTHTSLFTPISLQHRIFKKVAKAGIRERMLVLAQTSDDDAKVRLAGHVRLQESAFNTIPIAQIIVDLNGTLALANRVACDLFSLTIKDLGRPLRDLEISYRPVELRAQIEQVYSSQSPVMLTDIARSLPNGETQYLDVQITPLKANGDAILGASVTFVDVTRYYQMRVELLRSTQDLETTNEELQSSNEELETTNEELQSTNEELETTNEELQSSNEEFETINEELQSTNEELQTMNDEMQARTLDLNHSNEFLNSVLASLQMAVAVVDRQYNLLAWNRDAEDLWGPRESDVKGRSILSLDIGLPVGELRKPIRDCLSGKTDRTDYVLLATGARGRALQCRVSFSPLNGQNGLRRGVILRMEATEPDRADS